ncbi:MAG TPA: HD domain-containing protein [Egibacteraceae bacterium]
MNRLPAVRERTEELERASLSTWATLAAESKGRDRHEEPDPLRTVFQVDRDRIMGSDAFRLLRGKSKLLLATPAGAGVVRARLDDALAVAQVTRTIGRGLRLNEDLIEAIALGRDLGRAPFGDVDEEALSVFLDDGFDHAEQSLRIVERLERGGSGLNLTWEVRDGIVHHTAASGSASATMEGQVVAVAGRVASLLADLDALVRVGVVDPDAVPAEVTAALGPDHDTRVATLVADVITTTGDRPEVALSHRVATAADVVAGFLDEHLSRLPDVAAERDKAVHCLRSLAVFHLEAGAGTDTTGAEDAQRAIDHVVGLTDRSARQEFASRFSPSSGS